MINHTVRFKKGEGKVLENSKSIAVLRNYEDVDPREIAQPRFDFEHRKPLKPFYRSDGVVFESKDLDWIFMFIK